MSASATAPGQALAFRPPSTSGLPAPSAYHSPDFKFLQGKWHVTHSTLPMWKSKRNVTITYSLLPAAGPTSTPDETDRLDDLVRYQSLDSDKQHTVQGIDKRSGTTYDAWDWRGKGWLMIASSHWEVIGWGEEAGVAEDGSRNQWAVTYFAKTLFTPAGLDFYSKSGKGLQQGTIDQIKESLASMDSPEVKSLAGEVFAVKMDAT